MNRYSIVVRRSAELDVLEAQLWYEAQQIGLARQFYQEFAANIDRLAESPLLYPIVYRGVRRALLKRFPYLVWYQLEDSVITVLACTHGKSDPDRPKLRFEK